MVIALLLEGPAPFMPFQPSLRLTLFNGGLVGFSYVQMAVSSFSRAIKTSKEQGYNDDPNSYLLVSGAVWWRTL